MLPSTLKNKKRLISRPDGYNTGSNLPYYNRQSALELLPFLQHLVDEPDKKLVFNPAKLNLKRNTLYHKINQSWMWLAECHESKEQWKELREKYEICKEFLTIAIKKKLGSRKIDSSAVVVEKDTTEFSLERRSNWRQAVIEYIETSTDGSPPYEMRNLRLSERDVDWLSTYLGSIDERVATIVLTTARIKIVKNAALALALKKQKQTT